MIGEPDYGPLFVVGLLGIGAATVVVLANRKRPSSPSTSPTPTGPNTNGPEPPGGRPPSASPPGMPPPPDPKLTVSGSQSLHPSPLYLWILQDGATDWVGIGWYYGHAGQVGDSSHPGIHPVWWTPESEVRDVLDSLRDEGISGYFDTIEPTGYEDRNFKGRIDQGADSVGVWFWVEATEDDDAHYVAENAHYYQQYIG